MTVLWTMTSSLSPSSASASALCCPQAGPRGPPLLAYDTRLLDHVSPERMGNKSHPERPERASAVMARLQVTGVAERCRRITGREARVEELAAVHSLELVQELEECCTQLKLSTTGKHYLPGRVEYVSWISVHQCVTVDCEAAR